MIKNKNKGGKPMKEKKQNISEPEEKFFAKQGVVSLASENKGITLIALVITIIVLLILAGAAVSIGLSGDSIFNKANEAKTSWNRGVNEEDATLSNYIAYLDEYTGGGETTPTPSVSLPAGWNPDKVTEVYPSATASQKAPIPVGYKVSGVAGESSIATGLVIYETGNTDTTTEGFWTEIDANDGELVCQKTYNQYVWIPVADINDMVMCESNGQGTAGTIKINGVDQEGTTTSCHVELVTENDTTVLKCTNSAHSGTATDLCGRLYGGGSSFGTQSPATYTYNSGYREPAVVTSKSSATSVADYLTGTSYDGASNTILKEDGTTSVTGASNILAELKRQFNVMAKSVATYGGFYVGRYEAGYVGSACISKKATPVANILNTGSNSSSNPGGVGNWYGMYNKLIKAKTGTVSQMIWGCQWDQVMKFVNGKTDGNGDIYSVTAAKTTSGKTRHTGSKAATGANINDLVQNIYDLEGNFFEWTSMANDTIYRALRGGLCINSSAASNRGISSPTSTDSYRSARSGLYVAL